VKILYIFLFLVISGLRPDPAPVPGRWITVSRLKVRCEGRVIGTLNKGTLLDVIAEKRAGWYQINFGECRSGSLVSAAYLRPTPRQPIRNIQIIDTYNGWRDKLVSIPGLILLLLMLSVLHFLSAKGRGKPFPLHMIFLVDPAIAIVAFSIAEIFGGAYYWLAVVIVCGAIVIPLLAVLLLRAVDGALKFLGVSGSSARVTHEPSVPGALGRRLLRDLDLESSTPDIQDKALQVAGKGLMIRVMTAAFDRLGSKEVDRILGQFASRSSEDPTFNATFWPALQGR
jgi:hypothetical protein